MKPNNFPDEDHSIISLKKVKPEIPQGKSGGGRSGRKRDAVVTIVAAAPAIVK